jgi:hypothetical protein
MSLRVSHVWHRCLRMHAEQHRHHPWVFGQPELEPSEGLVLPVPPRPGSQLAEAGLERGDRIVAVDASWCMPIPRSSERCAVIRLASR